MAISVSTFVRRIALKDGLDLNKAIKDVCDAQAARIQHRRLVAAFESRNQIVLIFQRSPD